MVVKNDEEEKERLARGEPLAEKTKDERERDSAVHVHV
jgi:hypothetical protein